MYIEKPLLGKRPDWSLFPKPAALFVFNEGVGGSIYDLSGNGNHGTFVNDTHWINNKWGPIIDFDGSADHITVGTAGHGANIGSIVFRFKATAIISAHTDYIYKNSAGTLAPYILSSEFGVKLGTSYLDPNFGLSTGVWYDAAVTWRSGSYTIGMNGTIVKTGSYAGTVNPGTSAVIGSTSATEALNGQIAWVMIFPFMLTPQQISQLHIDPFPWFRPDPVYKWYTAPTGGIVILRRRRESA